MNFMAKSPIGAILVTAAALAMLNSGSAQAVLVHKYTFNDGAADDSIGTADGTVIDPGATTAVFTFNGQLDLSANSGQTSAAPTNDAYVDLPDGIISAAATSGVSGAMSLEFWATVSTQRTWQRFGDFGISNGGAGVSDSGSASAYLLMTPNSGRTSNGLEMTNHVATGAEPTLGLTGPFPLGVQQHVVAVYDKNNTSSGANPGGTMSLYLNGAAILPGGPGSTGTGAISTTFNLNSLNDLNNWLGRSQYGSDPVFDGLFNEFRIYSHALTPAEVTASFNTGPDQVPLPTLIVNKNTGAAAIRNLSANPITIDYYIIESPDPDGPGGTPGGALNAVGWNSLSDQNISANLAADFNNSSGFVNGADLATWRGAYGPGAGADADGDNDSDGDDLLIWQRQLGQTPEGNSWDEAAGSNNTRLIELYLNDGTSGGTTLAPNEQVSLGNAYNPATFGVANGNLTFRFGIRGSSGLVTGNVQYVVVGPAVGVPEPSGLVAAVTALIALQGSCRRRGRG